ncbi:MAG: AAA family ATPase, partial [Polyangiales bacterium]
MSATPLTLEALRASEVLSDLDVHFADAMCRLANERDERVRLGTALVSRQTQAGHVCLELRRLCQGALVLTAGDGSSVEAAFPDYAVWRDALAASPLVSSESAIAPLCLDGDGRLYLRRYFEHERALAADLLERAERPDLGVREHVLREGLDRLFGAEPRRARVRPDTRQLGLFEAQATPAGEPDLQRAAAERAVRRPLCVISGGPGTGKTSTVVKILALLVEQAHAEQPGTRPRVLLLAPTGKAAARLSEAIGRAKHALRCDETVRVAIAQEASTIHRALGGQTGGRRFRHDRGNPLAADTVVVDEASMVDLALMARLLDAVPSKARVILLGDRNQLASVEAGAVLGD